MASTRTTTEASTAIRTNISSTLVSMAIRRAVLSRLTLSKGKFAERDLPDYSQRNFEERGFTVGIGGYVLGSRGA